MLHQLIDDPDRTHHHHAFPLRHATEALVTSKEWTPFLLSESQRKAVIAADASSMGDQTGSIL